MHGIPDSVRTHLPRVLEDSPQGCWIACREATWDDVSLLNPLRTQEGSRGETVLLFPPEGPPQAPLPLAEAARFALEGRRRVRFTLSFPRGDAVLGPRPWIVGVLNATPDSFFDGGRYRGTEAALARGEKLVELGADWIDVGGESSRPGSDPVSAEEEMERVLPVIEALARRVAVPISVDTMKAKVAEAAVRAGATAVNDVSGLQADPQMAPTVARLGVPVVLNHLRGTPKDMQAAPVFEDPVAEVFEELVERADRGLRAGILPHRIVLDPGIGFGKRPEDNLAILRRLPELRSLGFPLMVGVSRKSFLGQILGGRAPEGRLHGSAAAVAVAAFGGAKLLRVHDPEEMKDAALVGAAIGSGSA